MKNVQQVMEQSIRKILDTNMIKLTNNQINENEKQDTLKNICVFNSIQDVRTVNLCNIWNKK